MAPQGKRAHNVAVADSAVEELPLYLVEPKVKPARSSPAASAAWAVALPSVGGAGRGSMLVMTRIVPLPPSIAVDALLAWWRARDGAQVLFHRTRFALATPAVRPEAFDQCQMRVQLHRPGHVRDMALEVELSPWSQSLTELDLRPMKWKTSLSEGYYAAGHAFLDVLERSMVRHAARRPVLNRRSWRGRP
jgi:hypothetical protein